MHLIDLALLKVHSLPDPNKLSVLVFVELLHEVYLGMILTVLMFEGLQPFVEDNAFLLFLFKVSHKTLFTIVHEAVFLNNLGVELLKFTIAKLIPVFDFLKLRSTVIKVTLQLVIQLSCNLKMMLGVTQGLV